MKTLEIYDPALCCSSGVCGPAPDEALAAFAGAVEKLKANGIAVKRFNLAQEPLAFAHKAEVKSVLEKEGEGGLPLVFIDDSLYFRGVYPSSQQLEKVLGIETSSCCADEEDCCSEPSKKEPMQFVKVEQPKVSDSSCCEPGSGCC